MLLSLQQLTIIYKLLPPPGSEPGSLGAVSRCLIHYDAPLSTLFSVSVRSFGTENRRTDHPVAPGDATDSRIIFKFSEIEYFEYPKPIIPEGLPHGHGHVTVQVGIFF